MANSYTFYAPSSQPTLAQVAKAAGVSATVASAFFKKSYEGAGGDGSGNVGIGELTQARLIAASRKLGYHPRDQSLRLRIYPEKGETCFLMPTDIAEGIANPYFGRFANGVISELHRQKRSLLFGYYEARLDYRAHPDALPAPLRDFQASRVILIGQENPSLLDVLAVRGCPAIYLSREVANPHVRCFVPDFAAAPAVALEHLRELGHSRIAIVAGAYMAGIPHSYGKLCAGLELAWARLWPGASVPRPELVHLPLDENRFRRLLEDTNRPTAVYCFDDYSAGEVISAAMRLGMKVPRDLAVVGTNNQLDSERYAVALTTVNLPGEEIGEEAVKALDDYSRLLGVTMTTVDIGGEQIGEAAVNALSVPSEPEEPRIRVFPVSLVVRASSGALSLKV
jgi:DNA-binding LacI/PurR family transcriptional regulator